MRPGRLKGIVQARGAKEKGLRPKRHLEAGRARLPDRAPGSSPPIEVPYDPIRNSGLFEKLLYLGRRRSVSYWSSTSTNFLLAVTVVMGR
jgi:hypothetical protein